MNLFDLPIEILDQICAYLETTFESYYWGCTTTKSAEVKNFQRLSLVNRRAHNIVLPLRYRSLVFEDGDWLAKFAQYTRDNPSRALMVRKLKLGWLCWQGEANHSLFRTPTWKLFTNLRELHLVDFLMISNLPNLSPIGEDFPNLETCHLNLHHRANHWPLSRPQRTVSDLMPFWGAPKLRRFDIEGGDLIDDDDDKRVGSTVYKRHPVAHLGFHAITILGKTCMEDLFASRTTCHLSLQSLYMDDDHLATILRLISSDLTTIHYSVPGRHYLLSTLGRWPNLGWLYGLRSMRIEMFHLFPLKPGNTLSFASYILHPLPESLKQLQVDIRTYWLSREEVYQGLRALICECSGKLVELQLRMVHRGDLRCLEDGVVENPFEDLPAGRENWRFTVAQMHELQQACSVAKIKLITESAWYRDVDKFLRLM